MRTSDLPEDRVVEVARGVLSGELDVLEGCRALVHLSVRLRNRDDDLFGPILGFESETEVYPSGSLREAWQKEALEQKDREFQQYLSKAKAEVFRACEALAERYSSHSD